MSVWDEVTEVLVIGSGGAGAVAAITAYNLGTKTLIVEEMEKGGRNNNLALDGFLCAKGINGFIQYLKNLYERVYLEFAPEMIRVFAEECRPNQDWVASLGGKTHVFGPAAFPQLSGADSIEKRMITSENNEVENSFKPN